MDEPEVKLNFSFVRFLSSMNKRGDDIFVNHLLQATHLWGFAFNMNEPEFKKIFCICNISFVRILSSMNKLKVKNFFVNNLL